MKRKHLMLLLLAASLVSVPGVMLLTGCTGKERAVSPVVPPPGPPVLEGRVIDSITGAPLAGAVVEVLSGGSVVARTTTAADGSFVLELPAEVTGREVIVRVTAPDGRRVAVAVIARRKVNVGRLQVPEQVVTEATPRPVALPPDEVERLGDAARAAPPGTRQITETVAGKRVVVPVFAADPARTPSPTAVIEEDRPILEVQEGTRVPIRLLAQTEVGALEATTTLEADGTLAEGLALPPTAPGEDSIITNDEPVFLQERGRGRQVAGRTVRIERILLIFQTRADGRTSLPLRYSLILPVAGTLGGLQLTVFEDPLTIGNNMLAAVVASGGRDVERIKVIARGEVEDLGEVGVGTFEPKLEDIATIEIDDIRRIVCIVRLEPATPDELRAARRRAEGRVE